MSSFTCFFLFNIISNLKQVYAVFVVANNLFDESEEK